MSVPVEHTPRWVIAARSVAAFVVIVMVVTPILLSLHTVDVRNNRREFNQAKLDTVAAQAKANAAAAANTRRILHHVCEVQNVDARGLNRVIDYFANIAKHNYPGPATDAFWAGVPRAIV